MERAYSGLRRKRKRAHSTKCPCCYSSEDEPENHTNLQKEKINEGTQIIGQRTRGRKSVQTSEEENEKREVRGVPCHPGEVIEAKKSGSAGAKKKTAREIKEVFGSKERKAARLRQENADTQQKDQKRQTIRGATTCNKKALRNSKTTQVEQAGQLNDDLEQRKALDVNKSNDTLRKSTKSRVKSRTKTSVDKKRTAREENNVSGLEKKDSEVKGKICRKQNSLGSKSVIISDNGIAMRLNQNQPGKNSIKARKKKVKTTQLTDSESGSPRKQNRVKANTEFSKNGKLQSTETISKKKVEVFDHLFAELKKCPGQSKASISMATELFLNFTSEKLKYLIQIPLSKTVKEDNQDLRQSVNTCTPSKTPVESKRKRVVSAAGLSSAQATDINDNCVSPPRKRGFRKSEETKLSQAAEALVSFRTNPSVLRQEKPEVDMQNTGVAKDSIAENSIGKKIDNPLGSVQKVMCSTSQDVEAFMQVVSTGCEAGLSQRNFSYSSPAAQNNLASKVSTSCLFQGAYLPQSLTSSGNLQQETTCGSNIFTFGQLTSQMGAALTVQAHIQPEVTTSSSVSESSAVMSTGFIRNPADVQNLQALLCTTPQPSNFQIQSTLPPPVTAYAACQSTQPRPTLSQPLKGMEDVVSCVGSHSAALLWNVKPAAPVVYITSPQTLSGVRARNIVPNDGQGALPFGAKPAKVSSLVVPNTSVNLQGADLSTLGNVTRMNQQGVPHSMSHTVSAPSQRPILPREQNSSFPTLPSSALQQPVTQGTSQIPGNSQPLGTGSMSLQSGILSVVSPLNRQPPTTYTTQMATLNTTHNAVSNTVTPVSAKQAVKRFVHERTKSAELKRTASVGNIPSTDTVDMPVTSSEKVVNLMCRLPVQSWTRQALNLNEQADASETSEFNLQQAASALLSISSQDGLDAVEVLQPGGDGDDSLDEPDDEVVFTSKGVFRVGDVDVDPKYNRIGREGYSCGKCGKIFTSLSYLARHIKRVCPDMSCRKWKCTMCDKAFRHPFGLQQHIYTHTGERPHKCSQCPKAFYSSNDLRRHSRIHSGERPYHCKHCEKSFATTISLKTHTYIHTGEKPHKCPHCPKTFATSSKLGRHIVTHSEERPFSCKQCPKSFNRSGDLRRHNMHVHETRDKSFGWDDCSGPLETLDCLNVDMDNHDDRSDNLERGSEASLQCMLHGET